MNKKKQRRLDRCTFTNIRLCIINYTAIDCLTRADETGDCYDIIGQLALFAAADRRRFLSGGPNIITAAQLVIEDAMYNGES